MERPVAALLEWTAVPRGQARRGRPERSVIAAREAHVDAAFPHTDPLTYAAASFAVYCVGHLEEAGAAREVETVRPRSAPTARKVGAVGAQRARHRITSITENCWRV